MTKFKRDLFGTDGIRGVAGKHPMTAEVALALGRSLSLFFREKSRKSPKIIIGKDTRRSGYMLETALTAGITSMGGRAYLLGPAPTPAVAYHIRGMRADAGVMISASHNPYQDNGLKVFGVDGFKLCDQAESEIEKMMKDPKSLESEAASPEELGRAQRIDDALGRYLVHLKSSFDRNFDLDGMKIVFDAANGAAYESGRRLLKELGAEVIPMACEPTGFNINKDCAQEDVRFLAETVLKNKAHCGLAVDGDGDRLMLVDEQGQSLSGEHFLYHIACFLKDLGRLRSNCVVTTVMTNKALEKALAEHSIRLIQGPVGDRYVTELMKKNDAVLGGETSGHFLFLDQNTTADGLFSALEVLALLKKKGLKASDLSNGFKLYPQKLVNIPVKEKRPLEKMQTVQKAIKAIEEAYEGRGRVNLRYSGTQFLLRLMVEAPDQQKLDRDIVHLEKVVSQEIGA